MEPLRLSPNEAGKLFGVETSTIRRALKRGELRYVVVRNRYKIMFDSLLAWSQTRAKVANKLASKGLGQYVDKWKIKTRLFSPNPGVLKK
ncbi:MAG: excisionase family DNA-binding protein [bacterium]|nr:excisionase family DNA-binding protein [bacterium]